MATAVQPVTPVTPASARTRLLTASATGAVIVLLGLAAALALPHYWDRFVAPALAPAGSVVEGGLRLLAQLGIVLGSFSLVRVVLGANPPFGVRGGIVLIVSAAITLFFVVRAIGLNLETSSLESSASIITFVIFGALLGLTFRALASESGVDWMRGLEEQGLVAFNNYKPAQGQRMRRYTLIGFLILTLSGVYSLMTHNMLVGPWTLEIPFLPAANRILVVLQDLSVAGPILLGVAAFFISWRLVNMHSFADFLIATEAEMKKVSWSSKKRLIQDTVVVLTTVLLMTLFFLFVDFFWSWLLSQKYIGVLPSQTPTVQSQALPQVDPVRGRLADW